MAGTKDIDVLTSERLRIRSCGLTKQVYVARAIRQFLSARKMTRENKSEYKTLVVFFISSNHSFLDRRWSTPHRFLVVMGGFHLFERSPEDTSRVDQGISLRDRSLEFGSPS